MGLFYSKKKDKRYITLKEAAALSGYSSDYVGQLIRSGKILGKRVYANPVWMTTEEELMNYLEADRANRSRRTGLGRKVADFLRSWRTGLRSELEIVKLYKGVLYFSISVSLVFSLFVFYVFSVNFDAWLSQRSQDRGELAAPIEAPVTGGAERVIDF